MSLKDVYRLVREGLLKGHKAKDSVLLNAESVERYLKTLHQNPPGA